PRIVLQQTNLAESGAGLQPEPFRPADQLPSTLPEGARRVISGSTAKKMRDMMQGVVTDGTGKAAQLNGYSSGGKTGTAQKIDPATHTYSHTKLVASFAGMAPVNSPAITVAVVIDTPTVGSRYGAAVSAPVFTEVAQQVLEYLGVPCDQPLKTKKQVIAQKDLVDDSVSDTSADPNAMFADLNNLPADDPLRAPATAPAAPEATGAAPATTAVATLPDKVVPVFRAGGGASEDGSASAALTAPKITPVAQARGNGQVVVDARKRVAVPAFQGAALRSVVEKAAASGLRVQAVGSGVAREQAPAAGTMVPPGTEVVVRFAR
ncbi:MAG: penicillin-binding transpeptidase domain-containing protein, partial [Acidobacteriaceae bacterium]|nr:penicillin-binding transpeptidase domain-containing protein [Acidobacteriaceae bacterium]